MLKKISDFGTALSKQKLQSIHGGSPICIYWDYNSLSDCKENGFGSEYIVCDPEVECDVWP